MEGLSTRQRTKEKFEQLFKLAIDGEKLRSSLLKKSTKLDAKKDDDEADNDVINVSDRVRLRKKKKDKNDKEGLLNHGFEDETLKSKQNQELNLNRESDVIELKPVANLTLAEKPLEENANNETSLNVDNFKQRIRRQRKKKSKKSDKVSTSVDEINEISSTNLVSDKIKEESLVESQTRLKRRRKKLQEQIDDDISQSVIEEKLEEITQSPLVEDNLKNEEAEMGDLKVFCVTIHRVDRLKMNLHIKHPLVRVHIVDVISGCCLKHSVKAKKIFKGNVEYILPSMTHPFDFQKKRSFIPMWEEQLQFNECFDYVVKSEKCILFFEILDFLPMQASGNLYKTVEHESGWYHVAWAFLKLIASNGEFNVDRRLQLQLFCPPKQRIRPQPRIVPVYHWWKSLPRVSYPGTLFVTVSSAVFHPETEQSSEVQKSDITASTSNQLATSNQNHHLQQQQPNQLPVTHFEPRWSRLPGQSCKVPNAQSIKLPTHGKGCYTASFSPDGRLIACANCVDNNSSVILLYDILSGETLNRYQNHYGLIYEINFSYESSLMVSASGDGSAKVWRIGSHNSESAAVLPHPSYVYCAKFHPFDKSLIATGCFDCIIRVWDISEPEVNIQERLVEELEHHESYVNTICFDKEGRRLFSGDNSGLICIWVANRDSRHWKLCQEIRKTELTAVAINHLSLHPTSNQLLIHSRDSSIRLMDLNSFVFVHHFNGLLNLCEKIHSCISPCGNYVFSGSEDHKVYVWNTVIGDQVAVYHDLPFQSTIHCVIYHPFDHILAMCSYGNNIPVTLYNYDPKVAQLNVSYVHPSINAEKRSNSVLSPIKRNLNEVTSKSVNLLNCEKQCSLNLTELESPNCLDRIIQKLDSVLDVTAIPQLSSSPWMTSKLMPLNTNSDVLFQVGYKHFTNTILIFALKLYS
ncbi:Jouberin, variant 2 [Chamberlinius hualienensis]